MRDRDDLLNVGAGWRVLGQAEEGQLGGAENAHEQVVEVVCDAAGQDPETFEPLRMLQLCLPLATRHFGAHPFGAVPQQPAQADESPLAVADPARGQSDGIRGSTPRLDHGLPLRHALGVSVMQSRHIRAESSVRFARNEHDEGFPYEEIVAHAQ